MSDNEPIEVTVEGQSLAHPDDLMPESLHLLPVAGRPCFPGQGVPLVVDAGHWESTVTAIQEDGHQLVGLVLTRGTHTEEASAEDLYKVGTVGRVHRTHHMDGKLHILVECSQRFTIEAFTSSEAPFTAKVSYRKRLTGKPDDEVKAYALAIINTIKELLPLNPLYQEELRMFVDRFGTDNPSHLTDFAAALTNSDKQELQEVLETYELVPRMEKVLQLLNKELEVAQAQQSIRETVEENMEKQQREFFLREQLRVIQQELGIAKDDKQAEYDMFSERLEGLQLSEEAQKRVDEEMKKLSMLEPGSAEHAVTRNYLDWVTVLPWGKHSADNLDLKKARKLLDSGHYGLNDVKQRILEFLAVGMMKGEVNGSIILLVGPPGVGKTSIGRSVADSLDREFYRFSLGGMRDEAEIKGHRRTYIGAMPGKFIQAMKSAGTQNPVIMLDEIDKVGASYHGDPASALLEVLDPEQNVDFMDHYLDLRFDLSKVLFIATANQLDTIPGPLLDRMEIIQLSGYITEEKVQIGKRYLLPKQIKLGGLDKADIKLGTPTLRTIIENYAREAGVRKLEKQLGKIVRKSVVKILDGQEKPIEVKPDDLESYLGPAVFRDERNLAGPGVVTGLAWTAMGGATLSIEAARTHTFSRGFKLTGQLGDVMKESAEIAYGYLVGHANEYGVDADFFKESFIHLHVPAGATPKDGPSAGITMASALLSLALNKSLRKIAMTGEITLTGQVFPVGGIREKVIAAKRSKIKELILPKENEGDFNEIPDHVKKGVKVHFVAHFDEVAPLLFK